MKEKKFKTKKQIKKSIIDFYVNFIDDLNGEEGKNEDPQFKLELIEEFEGNIEYFKNLSKKEWKTHIKYERMRECEAVLEKKGIKIDVEKEESMTFKEISSYKKKAKKLKFSREEKKAIKKYFKNKKKEIKDFDELCKNLKKLNITLEQLDNMSLLEIEEVPLFLQYQIRYMSKLRLRMMSK